MRKRLNEEAIDALVAKRKRYLVYDSIVPGLAVRVSPKGKKTFVMVARFNGNKHPTRRSLGVYGKLTLGRARETAQRVHRGSQSSRRTHLARSPSATSITSNASGDPMRLNGHSDANCSRGGSIRRCRRSRSAT